MTEEEIEKLGEEFVKVLKEIGITDIKDIPKNVNYKEDYYKDVWIIK